jgi:hypothetical protein
MEPGFAESNAKPGFVYSSFKATLHIFPISSKDTPNLHSSRYDMQQPLQ